MKLRKDWSIVSRFLPAATIDQSVTLSMLAEPSHYNAPAQPLIARTPQIMLYSRSKRGFLITRSRTGNPRTSALFWHPVYTITEAGPC